MSAENFIHPTAVVEISLPEGAGISVWQHVVIQNGARIGRACKIGANSYIEKDVSIGSRVTVKNNVAVYAGVTIEDDVFLGPSCVFTNVINPRSFISRKNEFRQTHIKCGATIGANATILCGHTVGRYAMVGAGSVVTKDVPDHALVMGNPASVKGYVCECGCTLEKSGALFYCRNCNRTYGFYQGGLRTAERK